MITKLLFRLFQDPEDAHKAAGWGLRFLGLPLIRDIGLVCTYVHDARLQQVVFGLPFLSPVGLAGGFDKEGRLVQGLEALWFGFIEVGSVTRHAQPGNPRQRIFRLERDHAVINRMGMNNSGADEIAKRLQTTRNRAPLGISLGKSKVTELHEAAGDYLYSFSKLYESGDYFAINVSSPNTPGLRKLQDKEALVGIVTVLNEYRDLQSVRKPLLVKVAPDLTDDALNEVIDVCTEHRIDGVIATNTTLSRDGLSVKSDETGGMSGKPLRNRATEVVRHIHRRAPALPIIGVGGIFTAEDAYEKIRAGASLVQIYTGFIYGGPFTASRIARGLAKLLKRDGFAKLADAVGVDA